MLTIFTKSVVSISEIPTNTIIERNMLTAKKPGTGIPEEDIDQVVGKKAKHNIGKDKVVKPTDIE